MATNQQKVQLDISRIKYENDSIKNVLNQLMTEYADYRIECDEICKEYEETIQLLTDSVEKYKVEITRLNNEKEKMKKDQEKLTKELEKSREKNKDKIKEIEILNNKLDELQSQFNSFISKDSTLKSKVVTLETDNDHYLNKIHQYEEEVSDLKNNLENTIESLITTQNEFEEYKNTKEEEIERLKLKLQEEKSNVKALMSQNSIKEYNRNKTNITSEQKKDEQFSQDDDEFDISKRNLSWDINDLLNKKNIKKENNNENEIKNQERNKIEKEQEYMVEFGKGRFNRAMTLQRSNIKFGEVLSNLRKRKEELVELNKKIKKDAAKILTK